MYNLKVVQTLPALPLVTTIYSLTVYQRDICRYLSESKTADIDVRADCMECPVAQLAYFSEGTILTKDFRERSEIGL